LSVLWVPTCAELVELQYLVVEAESVVEQDFEEEAAPKQEAVDGVGIAESQIVVENRCGTLIAVAKEVLLEKKELNLGLVWTEEVVMWREELAVVVLM
jgi:hypothetical protein